MYMYDWDILRVRVIQERLVQGLFWHFSHTFGMNSRQMYGQSVKRDLRVIQERLVQGLNVGHFGGKWPIPPKWPTFSGSKVSKETYASFKRDLYKVSFDTLAIHLAWIHLFCRSLLTYIGLFWRVYVSSDTFAIRLEWRVIRETWTRVPTLFGKGYLLSLDVCYVPVIIWSDHGATATRCNTLQYTATRCTALQHADIWYAPVIIMSERLQLQRTATHCNALQHTATHCNTIPYATYL